MINIKLFCAGGMSSGLLVKQMRRAAKDKDLDCFIEAYPLFMLERLLKNEHTDVILFGPQITFMIDRYTKLIEKENIPYKVIPGIDYGSLNGEKVLNSAIDLMAK